MKWRFDFKGLREDLRRIGIAIIAAGIVGGFIQHVSLGAMIYAVLVGAVLVLGSLFSREEQS